MADSLRQRRGKKSNGTSAVAETPSSATSPPSVETSNDDQPELTPVEQLRSARTRLEISRDRTADLHAAWKNQLFMLSLLIIIVTIHQLQSSISSCIREIKSSDGATDGATAGADALKLILGDNFCEVLGVVISSLLAYFLTLCITNAKMELESWPYMISSALVPITLGLYFHSTRLGCTGGDDLENISEESANDQRHKFPAVVIYHTIVTVAFWFMKSGMRQCEEHVTLVDDSIRDFERMDKKLALKKKLKSRGAGRKK